MPATVSATVDFLRDTITNFVEPNKKFTLQELLSKVSDPWDSVYDGRTSEDSREACVRADLQTLRDQGFLTFLDNDGTYFVNSKTSTKPSWGEEERELELQRMKNAHDLGLIPLPKGIGIEVVGYPQLLRKDQIIDHEEATKLGLLQYQQKREGNDADMNRVESIKESRKKDGYLLGAAPLPAVSKLKPRDGSIITEPIRGSDGKIKTHVLENGRHRFVGEDEEYFRCQEIDSEHQDFLDLYGTTANNPFGAHEAVGVTTEKDSIAASRMWIQKGRIIVIDGEDNQNLQKVCKFLLDNYPHINNRIVTARQILALEGVPCSIKGYYQKDVKKWVFGITNIPIEHDWDNKIARFTFILNSSTTMDRYLREVEKFQVEYPDFEIEIYASLDNTPSSRNEEVTPENINKLRRKQRELFEDSGDLNVNYANLKRYGKLKPIKFVFVPQDNKNENYNSLY